MKSSLGSEGTDGGLASLLPAVVYAALLPLAVLVLIAVDAVLRVIAEGRASRRRHGFSAARFAGAVRPALR